MKKLIAGNWKMNGSIQKNALLIQGIIKGIEAEPNLLSACDFAVFPPFVFIPSINKEIKNAAGKIILGAQDCSAFDAGAYTGEVSPLMLKETGCTHVILGHSERRQYHGETDELISRKAQAANKAGLITVICVGETLEEREAGEAQKIVGRQLSSSIPETATAENTIIAYEPVWAIGTGKTATPDDAQAMHGFIRKKLNEQLEDSQKLRILYGGSMKPENAKDLLAAPDIDGGLIGGASLQVADFLSIGRAAL
ncbi:MAG: triose-phosphate isomerase [Alphaproteobacteria bacterium]|nr:triose-phosphate isomerase [Alphaproteobacteria bacterium]